MLSRLAIDKFKQIETFSEELAAVTTFVGANNSGKSSVLQAVHSAVALSQSRLRLNGAAPMGQNGISFTISTQDTLYLPLIDISWLATDGRLTQSSGPEISMTFADEAKSIGKVKIKRGKNRNLWVSVEGREVISRVEQLKEPFSIYVPGLAGIAKAESYMAYGSLLRTIARGDANLVLRNVLYALKQKNEQWELFLKSLGNVFPEKSIYVRFEPASDEHIEVTVKQDEREIPLDCVGTGFLQTVQILSYIFLFAPKVTLLDEPDSHLHPNNQRALGELLLSLASEGKTQILLATHSRHLLDVFKDSDLTRVCWMKHGKVQASSASLEVLTDIGAFDSAEGLVSQGIDFVVLTEDQNKRLVSLLVEANGGVRGKFQVWAYKGCSRLEIAEALAKFINEVSPQTKIIVHRDADFLSDEDKVFLKQQFGRYGVTLFLPPTPDLEGVQCRVDHLKVLNPGQDAQIELAENQARTSVEAVLRESAYNGRIEANNWRHKQGLATEAKEAIRVWANRLDLSDERWRHGKKFIAAIRLQFKTATGANLKTDFVSEHLRVPELESWIRTVAGSVSRAGAPTATTPASASSEELQLG